MSCTPRQRMRALEARDRVQRDGGAHRLRERDRHLWELCYGRGDILRLLQEILRSTRECVVTKAQELRELYIQGILQVLTAEVWNSRNPMEDRDVAQTRDEFRVVERQLKECVDELVEKSRGFIEAHRDVINPLMTEIANWQQGLLDAHWYLQGFQPPPDTDPGQASDYASRQFQADIEEYTRFRALEDRAENLRTGIQLIEEELDRLNSQLSRARRAGDPARVRELRGRLGEVRVSLGEFRTNLRETRAEAAPLDPRRRSQSRREEIERRWRRVERHLEARRRLEDLYLPRAHEAWIGALQQLAQWYPWLPRQAPGGVDIDQLPSGRRVDPYVRRHYPIFTGGAWDRQRLWELYLLTLERLAEGTGFFEINRLVSAISGLYGPANRGLDFGATVTSNATSYPGHGYFAIDVGEQPGVEVFVRAPDRITLPSRFWKASYRYRSSSTVPAGTRAISADQNVFGGLSYGMGWTRSHTIERFIEQARRATEENEDGAARRAQQAEAATGEAIEDALLPAQSSTPTLQVPPRPPEFGASPLPSRVLFGLGSHGVIAESEIAPEVRAARRELLEDLAVRIESRLGITQPFSQEALEGSARVQMIDHVFRAGEARRRRGEIEDLVREWVRHESPSEDPLTSDGVADRIWVLNWMLLQGRRVEPHRKAQSVTIEHVYEKVDGLGPETIQVRVFMTHMRSISRDVLSSEPVPVDRGRLVGTAGSSGNAVTPHVHIEITIHVDDQDEPLGGLWLHEFFEPPPLPAPPLD